jgi:hypothetical protein
VRLLASLTFGSVAALTVGGCSLLLDWDGYTGLDAGPGVAEDAESPGDGRDATDAAESGRDARAEAAVEAGPDAQAEAGQDAAEAGTLADGQAPPCASTCGGCCDDAGNCVGGQSNMTCGTNGARCEDCTALGERCGGGVCTSAPPPQDAGTCVASMCPPLCIPVYQTTCCKTTDGTCGCQIQIPPSPTCR